MDSDKDQIDAGDYTSNTITINGHPYTASANIIGNMPASIFEYDTLSTGIVAQPAGALAGGYTFDHGNWSTTSIPTMLEKSGQLSLQGENADIVINGVSLVDKLDAIAERLNMLAVNPELEEEWDQLRELGEQYRQLELDLKAKSAMWNTLKTKTLNKPRT
jgi:hypothetical protein